ncbi:MAG: bifunctional folylpolyglutamate synthase/dihydrofolate synthase [Syntrophales bacterium]|jgi:dihydrofolate synthase/folylpolyglutamate synthase|nr:bifunctional folylpolyglutamate synthase/dihydrofolate synthase [Syntrophales bacterium]MDY0043151.1 folylpolyglutamate synthase/dihydrofolate synthase family protein [Syntrophales bacterium]
MNQTLKKYQEAVAYLSQFERKGIHMDLGYIAKLLADLGNPHKKYKSVHIGGTNGKGSVGAMLSCILDKAGYKVGLYTSPHLVDLRERIRLNGTMISEKDFLFLVNRIRSRNCENITYFEFLTSIALLYFHIQEVDIAIIEVGMGGRLDATNLIEPELSVITNISIEHQQYLGRHLDDIAREKGGIIKKNNYIVTGAKQKKAVAILEEIANNQHSCLYKNGRDFKVISKYKSSFSYYGIKNSYRNLNISLNGRHQIDNAALALASAELLKERGFYISDLALQTGIADARWDGRLELVSLSPSVVLDGAHNPAGISSLSRALRMDFSYTKLIVVFGVMEDKNYIQMFNTLANIANTIICTEPEAVRTLSMKRLQAAVRPGHVHVEYVKIPREALLRASQLASRGDLIVVTGSLFLIGEIKADYPF